jgi:pimeloyl-ACP methyl ester carboxylesterase
VFCGHDWGGMVVWQMAHLHPDRVAGVIGVNTPYLPRGPIAPTQMLRQMRGENNYIVYFQQPGVADKYLADNVEKAFRAFMSKSSMTAADFAKLPADSPARNFDLKAMIEAGSLDTSRGYVCTEEELQVYIETFRETGFTGGINWYRNMDRNWESTAGQPQKLDKPSLYVGAEDDVVLPPSMADATKALLTDHEMHVIEDCGHWTQQEKAEELNTILIGWLTKRFGRS